MKRKNYEAAYSTSVSTNEEGSIIISQSYEIGESDAVILSIHQAEWLYDILPMMIKEAKDDKELHESCEGL
jgi:hypothetical protein